MMKRIARLMGLVFLFALSLLFFSCEDLLGYGVVLWNAPEHNLHDGDVVPVYIRSNISQVYVIGRADGEKVELPLWQISEPVKKNKVAAVAARYSEYANVYASVKLDGLPCRAEPVNTAKQVYRLRKGEVIKILFKGEGQQVMSGQTALEGDWFRILTDNGTQGWCFSYNLNLYEVDSEGNAAATATVTEEDVSDAEMEAALEKIWYPDYFATMLQSGNIDLARMNPAYRFSVDTENKKVSLNTASVHELWTYSGYKKTDDRQFTFNGIPLVLICRRPDYIVLRYTGESGKPQELNFVTLERDVNEVIRSERARRTAELNKVISHGSKFTSSSYGTLTVSDDGSFKWTNNKLLVPAVIASGAKNVGMLSVKYSVAKKLSESYDGVLTFSFDGMSDEVNFFYKLEDGGLRLEDATKAKFNGTVAEARSTNALILYFRN